MKILHVQKVSGVGGSERHLLSLLPALNGYGCTVSMLVLSAGGASEPFVSKLRSEGIDVHEVLARGDLQPRLIPLIAQKIRALRPDLVHTHLIHADVYGQVAAAGARVPALNSFHSSNPFYQQQPIRTTMRQIARFPRATIAISQHVRNFVLANQFALPDRVRLVPYGLNPAVLRDDISADAARGAFGLSRDEIAIGVASRLFPNKGQDVVIEAMRRVVERDSRAILLVAGDGPERSRLEQLAGPLLSTRIRFLGHINNIASFMTACEIMVFPTQPGFGEGFGLAALEAMCCARPLVATDIDSLPEIVVDGRTGYLVPPRDTSALAERLLRLLHDGAERSRMGREGLTRATVVFPLERMVANTVAVYEETA